MFQSRNRDAFQFGRPYCAITALQPFSVSISQSRCCSCQGGKPSISGDRNGRFNLAIEMLFMSGTYNGRVATYEIQGFQSRNRDAFQFMCRGNPRTHRLLFSVSISQSRCFSFQVMLQQLLGHQRIQFQSRNREAFQFRLSELIESGERTVFQSRNRDAFQFRPRNPPRNPISPLYVSISQSRCFSVQG